MIISRRKSHGKTNNILYVMAYKNFQDEEYFETKKYLKITDIKQKSLPQ